MKCDETMYIIHPWWQVLNAYCLVSTGVRIICSNTVGQGRKNIVMATKGDENVKDNIVR